MYEVFRLMKIWEKQKKKYLKIRWPFCKCRNLGIDEYVQILFIDEMWIMLTNNLFLWKRKKLCLCLLSKYFQNRSSKGFVHYSAIVFSSHFTRFRKKIRRCCWVPFMWLFIYADYIGCAVAWNINLKKLFLVRNWKIEII